MKNKSQIMLLWLIVLAASLACRLATRLVSPNTPTPGPSPTHTLTPFPSPTVTPTAITSCPGLLLDVLDTASSLKINTKKVPAINYLVTYTVTDDQIDDPMYRFIPFGLKDEQHDRAAHEAIWNYFTAIIPPEQRNYIANFSVFTDGQGYAWGAVAQNYMDMSLWELRVDILDSSNRYKLTFMLLHEFGHLLTLNSNQVPPSGAAFMNSDAIYEKEVAACRQYYPPEGCSKPESYINMFYNRFWTETFQEWKKIDQQKEERAIYNKALFDFYTKYKDQFVTEYAATNPSEDIAESWTFFLLSPKPGPDSIAGEKIRFFYEYPELIKLRSQIRERVCNEFPR